MNECNAEVKLISRVPCSGHTLHGYTLHYMVHAIIKLNDLVIQ